MIIFYNVFDQIKLILSLVLLTIFFLLSHTVYSQKLIYKDHIHYNYNNYSTAVHDLIGTKDNGTLAIFGYKDYIDLDPTPVLIRDGKINRRTVTLVKYDSLNQYEWHMSTPGALSGPKLYLDSSENIFISCWGGSIDASFGSSNQSVTTNGDFGIIKLNSQGDYINSVFFNDSVNYNNAFRSSGFEVDRNGNIYLSASFAYQTNIDPNNSTPTYAPPLANGDGLLLKLDSNFLLKWYKVMGSPNRVENTEGLVLIDSSIYVTIEYSYDSIYINYPHTNTKLRGQFYYNIALLKYDLNGNLDTVITYMNYRRGKLIKRKNDSTFYLLGYPGSSPYDVDLSSDSLILNRINWWEETAIIQFKKDLGVKKAKYINRLSALSNNLPYRDHLFATNNKFYLLFYNSGGYFLQSLDSNLDIVDSSHISNNFGVDVYGISQKKINGNIMLGLNYKGIFDIDLADSTELNINSNNNEKAIIVEYSHCITDTLILFDTICEGDSILFGSKFIKRAGTYYDEIYNSSYCDSLSILILTVTKVPTQLVFSNDTISLFNKNLDSYTWYNSNTNNQVASNQYFYIPNTNDSFYSTVSLNGCSKNTNYINIASQKTRTVPVLDWGFTIENFSVNNFSEPLIDNNNNIYLSASYNDRVDVDPSEDSLYYHGEDGGNGVAIIKYSPDKEFQWIYQIKADRIIDKKLTKDGELIVVGYFTGTVDFDPRPKYEQIKSESNGNTFVLKIDADGHFEWVKNFGHIETEISFIDVSLTNGNILLGGTTRYWSSDIDPNQTSNIISTGGFFALYDDNMNIITSHQIPRGWNNSYGSFNSGLFDSENNIVLTGVTVETTDFDFSYSGTAIISGTLHDNLYFLAKYDSLTNFKWVRKIGESSGPNSNTDERKWIVTNDNQDNIVLTGQLLNGIFNDGHFAAKYSPTGSLIKRYDFRDYDFAIHYLYTRPVFDKFNNLYLLGEGDTNTRFSYDSNNISFDSLNYLFLAKYLENGNLNWAFGIQRDIPARSYINMAIDENQNLYLFSNGDTIDFDIDPDTTSTFFLNSSFSFFAKYNQECFKVDTTINFLNYKAEVNPYVFYEWKNCNNDSTVFISLGKDFFPQSPGSYYAIAYAGDCFDTISCKSFSFTTNINPSSDFNFNIYPNPSSESVNIITEKVIDKYYLYSTNGKIITEGTPSSKLFYIDLSRLKKGVYFIKCKSGDKIKIKKVVLN